MKRFLLHGLALLVVSSVGPHGVAVEARGATRRAGAAQVRLGREFKLRAGRPVTFEGKDLRLKLLRVASDSRCPADVNCVWAGNAEVQVEVGAGSGKRKTTLRLNTNAGPERPGEGKYGRYTVKLVGLSPQPRAGKKIKAGEYTATLLVTLVIVD